MDLPIYQAILGNEKDGIFAISLVDFPATESNYEFFSKAEEIQRFAIQNEEKQMISGVLMLADTPIYRCDGDFKYYIKYSKETLAEMAEKLLFTCQHNNIDVMHDGKLIGGVNLVELYIKDSSKGIVPTFLSDVPDGSLIVTYHVPDKDLFNAIKESGLKGFSLAGRFSYKEPEVYKKEKNNFKMKFSKLIKEILVKFSALNTDKGIISYEGSEELVVGDNVYIEDENGNHTEIADGDYTTDNGIVISIENGKVINITEPATEEPEVTEEAEAEEETATTETTEEEETATTETTEEEEAEEVEEVAETAETETEVEEEVAEDNAELDALKAENEELKAKIAELEAKLEELVHKPVVESVEEQFAKIKEKEEKKTFNIYSR